MHMPLAKVIIAAMLSVLVLQEPAMACSPQELAVEINTLTDLMIAHESGQAPQHADFMKRMRATILQTASVSSVSYNALCVSYGQLIIQLRSLPHRP
jgi:hypothetical protein